VLNKKGALYAPFIKYLSMKYWHYIIIFFTILSTFICSFATAQDSDGNSYYVEQYKGSENLVSEYFSNHTPDSIDTILCVFIPPMGCPRCEGVINVFMHKYKKLSSDPFTICIVFGDNNDEIKQYLAKRNYSSDKIIVDNTNELLNSFKFSSNTLSVPFFMKINAKTGELINYKSSLGIELSDQTVDSFISINRDLLIEKEIKKEEVDCLYTRIQKHKSVSQLPIIKTIQDSLLKIPHDIISANISSNGEFLSLVGRIDNTVYLLSDSNAKISLLSSTSPLKEEEEMFIDHSVSDTIVLFLKRTGILNTMYLRSIPDNHGNQYIAASLPKVYYENEESLTYFNSPVIIKVDHQNYRQYTFFNEDDLLGDADIVMIHKSFFVNNVSSEKPKFYLPIHKGWPACGTDSEILNQSNLNPFKSEFYKNTPLFAVFDNSGNEIRKQYSLGDFYSNHKVGYFYSNPNVRFFDNSQIFFDMYSGEVCHYDNEMCLIKSYHVFNNEDVHIIESENKIDQIKSLVGQMDEVLIDVRLYDECLYGIIEGPKLFYIISIDEHGGKVLNKYKKSVGSDYEKLFLVEKDNVLKVKILIADNEGIRILESYPI